MIAARTKGLVARCAKNGFAWRIAFVATLIAATGLFLAHLLAAEPIRPVIIVCIFSGG